MQQQNCQLCLASALRVPVCCHVRARLASLTLCRQRFLKRYEAARGLGGRQREDRKQRQTEKEDPADPRREAAAATAAAATTLSFNSSTVVGQTGKPNEAGGEGQPAQCEVHMPSSPRAAVRNTIDPK